MRFMHKTMQLPAHLLFFAIAMFTFSLGLHAQYLTGEQIKATFITSTGEKLWKTFTVDSTPNVIEATSDYLTCDVFDKGAPRATIRLGCPVDSIAQFRNSKVRFTFLSLPSPAFKNAYLTNVNWAGIDESRLSQGTDWVQIDISNLGVKTTNVVDINLDNPGFTLPELSIRTSHVELCWSAVVGDRYQIQYQEGSIGGQWINIGSPFTASSNPMCNTQAIVALPRFYRIVGVP